MKLNKNCQWCESGTIWSFNIIRNLTSELLVLNSRNVTLSKTMNLRLLYFYFLNFIYLRLLYLIYFTAQKCMTIDWQYLTWHIENYNLYIIIIHIIFNIYNLIWIMGCMHIDGSLLDSIVDILQHVLIKVFVSIYSLQIFLELLFKKTKKQCS